MRHARRFGGGDGIFVVGAHRHAFRLDAYRNFAEHVARLDVHDGDERVVLVGDVDLLALLIHGHQLGIGTRVELARLLQRIGVYYVHGVAVTGGHEQLLEVGAQHDAAWSARYFDGVDDLEGVSINHGDRVVLLVGDEDGRGEGRR